MRLQRQKLMLSTGETAWCEYDQDSDLLEIIFRQAEATCAIELTESIILRFDWDTSEPLSLSFISFARLAQPKAYGEVHFQLLIDEWSEEAKAKVWQMLHQPPLTDFLSLSSYAPAHTHEIIPSASIKPLHLVA